MSDKITKLPVGHDFAPGAEPEFWDLFVLQFMKIFANPAAMSAIVILVVALTAYAIFKLVRGGRKPYSRPVIETARRDESLKEDLAALRRRRQSKAEQVDKLGAA